MNSGDPIEEQCVRMFGMVYGNPAQNGADLQAAFAQQEPAIIEGWRRLARSVSKVTTPATLSM